MSLKVLVTGGAGFVGSHTVDALLRAGCEVRIFDNLDEQVHRGRTPAWLQPEAEFIHGDMRDPDAVRRAVASVEVVVHLAAAVGVGQSMYEIARYMAVNTQGTANLLQALLDRGAKVEKLLVASSMSIYGEGQYRCDLHGMVAPAVRSAVQLLAHEWQLRCPECEGRLQPVATTEEKPLQCSSIYALGKKDQEEMALLFGRTYNLPVVSLRYFNIYGTRQSLSNPYTGVAAIFASRLMNQRAPLVFEDGRQQRDFVSVHDVVQASLLAIGSSGADGYAVNIGSGAAVTIQQVAEMLATTLQMTVPPEITGRFRAGDVRHCFADISRAHKLLGYEPRYTLQEGLEELVEWLRWQRAVDRVEEASRQLATYGLTA